MEPKYVITKVVVGVKLYLTRDGWLGDIEDRKKLMYTASDAQTIVAALRYLDNGSALINYEEVGKFQYLKDDAVYSPDKHCTTYMKKEVAQKFARAYKEYISRYDEEYILEVLDEPTLINSFDWSDTEEGASYWGDVNRELKELAKR
jgi:hypothetical protein